MFKSHFKGSSTALSEIASIYTHLT